MPEAHSKLSRAAAKASLHFAVQADREEIEGESKNATADYAVVLSVPGSADNKQDSTAEKVEHTYARKAARTPRARNELSGAP